MSQIALYVEGPTQENVHPPYVDNLIRGLVEHLAGHGQQITDAGDRRCWRQVCRTPPDIRQPRSADTA